MAHSSESGTESKAAQTEKERQPPVAEVIRTAMEQLALLLNQPAEAVSSCGRGEDGDWHLTVEVLELQRVPDTMSLLASYEVEADHSGHLIGYRRTRRYERGRADRR
ncbi:gas vesicle protein GvpO [Streptomyces sp. NPDC002773]|uniref:gas vesicle protein GvpO n=1 Tax=Streptomyces sp. NPDC002773 TaxID=3154430 RepID=UPI003321EC99